MKDKTYSEFFKRLTSCVPYDYQQNCFDNLSLNKSIILQAPTGSGKTLASVLPFVYNWIMWKEGRQSVGECPRKLIYSLPLRTLANSLFKKISEIISNLDFNEKPKVTLQTGEYPNDEFFEGDIIFTTIDQTLSNILSIPLSLPNKLANINAGAVLSSYLVFDEFHLLDPEKSLSTTLVILDKLKDILPFCLMTATLTDSFIIDIANSFKCEIVKVGETDFEKLSFIKNNQKRILNVREKEIELSDILELHKNKTIIICNTVRSCSKLAEQILEYVTEKDMNTEVICLHSRFFQKHRNKKEKKILEFFGKDSPKKNVILITTQIIEVGLDISCNTMIAEVSPINSFIQRIGRSARWGETSQIFVFHPEKEYVYNDKITEKTFEILKQNNNTEIDRNLTQQMITDILTDSEKQIFENIKENGQNTWDLITQSWQSGNKGFSRELIRDIHSVRVVLVGEEEKKIDLFNYESVSFSPFSLKNELQKILKKYEGEQPKLAFNLQESTFSLDEDDEDLELTPIAIDKILDENIIGLNAKYIGYSEFFGLDFEGNFGYLSKKKENKKNKINIKYKYDTFEEHNNWMIEVFEDMYDYQFSLSKLQNKHYQDFNFEELIKFMIICHDFGKLRKLN